MATRTRNDPAQNATKNLIFIMPIHIICILKRNFYINKKLVGLYSIVL